MKVNIENISEALESNSEDMVRAVGYWLLLSDLTKFFKKANMPKVYYHLSEACKEIDCYWQEYEDSRKLINIK